MSGIPAGDIRTAILPSPGFSSSRANKWPEGLKEKTIDQAVIKWVINDYAGDDWNDDNKVGYIGKYANGDDRDKPMMTTISFEKTVIWGAIRSCDWL